MALDAGATIIVGGIKFADDARAQWIVSTNMPPGRTFPSGTTLEAAVASRQASADEVVQMWLQSPGHCANLMNPEMREMGIAYAFDAASAAGTYWAQVLAARR